MTGMNKLFAAGLVVGLAGCGTGTDVGTNPNANLVTFSFVAPAGNGPAAGAAASLATDGSEGESYNDGQNTLTITKVELVIGDFILQRFGDCDANPDATGCDDFQIGPLLVDVPLGDLARQFTVEVDVGTYFGVEMEIYMASGNNPGDADFIAANPQMDGNSIRIEGTFNGEAFTYTTDLDAHQGFFLEPPLVIDETKTSTNMTIVLNLDQFFVDESGTFVDPRLANVGGEFEVMVEENIVKAIKAFEDEDEDGQNEEDHIG